MLFWNNIGTVTNAIWAALESIVIIGAPVFYISRMFKKIDKRLDKIEYQLYENGGGSMKDQMNNQDKALHELQINQAIIKTKLEI
jgi:chitinase